MTTMQVTEVANEGLKRAYTVVVPASDIAEQRTRRLGELGRELRLPGFRPGKVPASVVRQRYGQAVMSEVLEQSVSQATQQIMTDRGLRPAQQPKIELVNFSDASDLEFKMELELLPEIPMPDFAAIELERLRAEPEEAAVAKAIEGIASRNRSFEEITEERGAAVGEVAVCDFVGRLRAPAANLLSEPEINAAAGTAPRSWRVVGVKEGLAAVLGAGEQDGRAYLDIRFHGVLKSARIDLDRIIATEAKPGDGFRMGMSVQLLAGTIPDGARARFTLSLRDGNGKGIGNAVAMTELPGAEFAPFAGTLTLAAPTEGEIVGLLPIYEIVRLPAEPVDFTLRISSPVLTAAAGGAGEVEPEPFAGGSATDASIEVAGSGFIPGFTEQLEGIRAGETRLVEVSFPADYGSQALAGRAAVFTVTCKGLKRPLTPAADDALAKTMGFDGLGALQAAVRGSLQQEYDNLSRLRVKRALLDGLAAQAAFPVPEGLVEAEFTQIWSRVEADMKAGRGDAEDQGKPEEVLRADYRAIAERRVRLGLLLSEIGRTNNITVTADEVSRAMRQEAARYPGQERMVMEFFQKNPQAADNLRSPIFEEKVVDFMLELAKVTDRTVPPEELAAGAAA